MVSFLKDMPVKKTKLFLILLTLLSLLGSLSASLIPSKVVYAATPFAYADASNQTIRGPSLPDGNDSLEYKRASEGLYLGQHISCTLEIRTKNGKDGGTQATWVNGCNRSPVDITIVSFSNNTVGFNWVNSGQIDSTDGRQYIGDPTSTDPGGLANYFFQKNAGEGKCVDTLIKKTDTEATLIISVEAGSGNEAINDAKNAYSFSNILPNIKSASSAGNGCWNINDIEISLGQTANAALPAATGPAGAGQPTCESTGFSLSWIVCPIINGIADVADKFFDEAIRPLLEFDSSNLTDTTRGTYKVWSSFRIIANVLLVLFVLVAVFGQAFGGGLVDAYTVKKIMPRVLLTAILINLSIYLVAIAVDITNIIAAGLANLIYLPFKEGNQFKFSVDGTFSGLALGGTGVGIAAGVGILMGAGGVTALLGTATSFIVLFILMPAILAIVGTFVTLIIRQGLIVLLIMVAPVAFALYCLPNTEKYFKKWWDLLFKTLMVFPLIIAIFAVADVLVVAIDLGKGLPVLTSVVQLVLLVLPLFLIPFAFKLAGGAITALYGAISSAGKKSLEAYKGNPNDPYSRRNVARRGMEHAVLGGREIAVNKGIGMQKRNRFGVGAIAGGALAKLTGGSNYEAARARKNAEAKELVQSQVSSGADNLVRALFARQLQYKEADQYDDNGNLVKRGEVKTGWFGTAASVGEDGLVAGASEPQFSEYEVSTARSLFGHNPSGYQAAYTYEVGKASNDRILDTIDAVHLRNMNELGLGGPYQQDGATIGSNFELQNTRRERKHTKMLRDGSGKVTGYERNRHAFTQEVSENVQNYPLSNMRTSTIKALRDDAAWAKAVVGGQREYTRHDGETVPVFQKGDGTAYTEQEVEQAQRQAPQIVEFVRKTADSLDARMGAGGGFAVTQGEEGVPVSGNATGAAGLVNEQIGLLINENASPRPTRGGGGRSGAPTAPGGPAVGNGGPGAPGGP